MECGVAVAAMVTGVRYEDVLDRWFGCLTVEDGIREIAFWRILQDITQVEWRITDLRAPRPLVSDYSFPAAPSAAIIQGPSWRHYIAVQGCKVLDPLLAMPMDQTEYPNGGWRVQSIFTATAVVVGAG
jgi:hypothetical protein